MTEFIHKNIIVAHHKLPVVIKRLHNSYGNGWCIEIAGGLLDRDYYNYSQREAVAMFKQYVIEWAKAQG